MHNLLFHPYRAYSSGHHRSQFLFQLLTDGWPDGVDLGGCLNIEFFYTNKWSCRPTHLTDHGIVAAAVPASASKFARFESSWLQRVRNTA